MNYVMMSTEELKNLYESIKNIKIQQKCPRCDSDTRITDNIKFYLRCKWKKCSFHFSIWKGSIFENTRIDHILMLQIINLWSINVPNLLISRTLGCNKQAVYQTLKILRHQNLYQKYLDQFKQLGGDDMIVELDKSKIGKNKHHCGKPVKGFWCFGMVERTKDRKFICMQINQRNKVTLLPIILRYINENSIVYSDMWKAYHSLKNYFKNHKIVNHSINFKDVITGVHTNTIEGNWRSLKASIPLRCRTKTLSPLYLFRYMIRRNEHGITTENILKYCF